MIRNGDYYGLAVRKPDNTIFASREPWRKLFDPFWMGLPFIRGFPILIESLANGIQGLLFSVSLQEEKKRESEKAQTILTLCAALLIALLLFVLLPHLLSLLMLAFHLGSDLEDISFYFWDGFFKCSIFVFYIVCISFVPEIRRLFENHGAEHKIVRAYENGYGLNLSQGRGLSRLHPRCGTTFLLFVICVSIILQALVVPPLLAFWAPKIWILKHLWSIFLKLLLIAPVSGISFEIIRFASSLRHGFLRNLLLWPGLALQYLTTREPDASQLEVAAVALAYALHEEYD